MSAPARPDLTETQPLPVERQPRTAPSEVPPVPDAEPPPPLEPEWPVDAVEPAGPVEPARTWRSRVPWSPLAIAAAWLGAAAILAVAAGVAWWVVEPQLGKPYVYDEAAFAFAGRAVADTGLPLSNVGHLQTETPGDFSKRFNWALWHPPLYIFALGYAFRIWGETEQTARLLGVACNALAALLAFFTATVVLAPRTRAAPLYAATGTALYLTNPLVIQSALLLDIDGTVLVASVSLLAFTYVLLLGSPAPLAARRTWLLLGLCSFAFGLSLWAKMTTPLCIPVVAAVYRLVATRPWRPWRAFVELPVVAVAGTGLFVATWWFASAATGMPFDFPFRILWLELHEATGSTRAWRENPRVLLELVSHVALWVSPYLVALFAWAGLVRLADLAVGPLYAGGRRLLRRPAAGEPWGARPVDFVLACGGAVGIAYLIKLAASFPKYHITMMPFWAVGIAYLVSRYVPRLSWWEPPVYAVVLSGMAGYFVTFVGDKYVLFRGWEFVLPLLVWPAALGFAFLTLGMALGRYHLPRQLTILGLLLTVAWSWGVSLAQRQADYSTAYNYGTAGQREAAAYLNTVLRQNEPYVASRDVAYYVSDPVFIDQDTWWEHILRLEAQGVKSFDGRLLGYPEIDVLALFLWDPTLGTIAHSYMAARYEVSFQSGPYVVFVRTS